MNPKDKEYVTYMRKRGGNTLHLESKSESEEKERSNMGDRCEQPEGSTVSILNDLAREQE